MQAPARTEDARPAKPRRFVLPETLCSSDVTNLETASRVHQDG